MRADNLICGDPVGIQRCSVRALASRFQSNPTQRYPYLHELETSVLQPLKDMKVFRATRTNSKAEDPFAAHRMSGDTRKQRVQRLLQLSVVLWLVLGSRILIAQEHLKASYEAAQELFQRGEDERADAAFRKLVAETDPLRSALLGKTTSPEDRDLLGIYTQVQATANNYLGLIAAHQTRFAEAAQQFARVLALQPDFPDADFNFGLALFFSQNYSRAVAPLEQAGARAPANLKVKRYLGLTYVQIEEYSKATPLLEEVRSQHPDDPDVLLALATAWAHTKHFSESQQILQGLLTSEPGSASLHLLRGQVYAAAFQTREAEQEFQSALQFDPNLATVHFYLGMLRLKAGRLQDAQGEFEAELVSHPQEARAQYHLAFVLLAQQKSVQAIPLLRRVIAEQPDYAEAHYSLGKVLLEQSNLNEAIQHLETATRLDSGESYSHYQLARAYVQAGRSADAQREFKITQQLEVVERSGFSRDEEQGR
jgi:predicted Zn-dependent protease